MICVKEFEEKTASLGVLGVIISQNGEEILHKKWDDEIIRNVYSASKSFTSTAVGIAVKEGLLSLDEKLTDAFAEDMPKEISDNLAKATVRDLLTMCLGQEGGHLMGEQRPLYKEDDWVKLALSIPFVYEPGTHFQYNNVGPYLAGVLVQRRAGCDLISYLMPRLFTPLGIKRPTWECDPMGYIFGAGGLMITLSQLHKLGLLYLNDGVWNGKQIIPKEWVMEAGKGQDDEKYGYLFWTGPHHSFRADGKYGQYSIVIKEKNAVITVVAECRDMAKLHQAVFDTLYPQL